MGDQCIDTLFEQIEFLDRQYVQLLEIVLDGFDDLPVWAQHGAHELARDRRHDSAEEQPEKNQQHHHYAERSVCAERFLMNLLSRVFWVVSWLLFTRQAEAHLLSGIAAICVRHRRFLAIGFSNGGGWGSEHIR
jgi:hypothetical protein